MLCEMNRFLLMGLIVRFVGGGGGARPQNVLIYNFPYEIEHSVVRAVLIFFGEVVPVRFRHWPHLTEVCDGVCTVILVHTRAIPR